MKMRTKDILLFLALAMASILASCSKNVKPASISFGVVSLNSSRQPATTFTLGDTVFFNFAGDPNQITFFSGQLGNRYQYISRDTDASSIDTLRLTSVLNTPGAGALQLLVSTGFPGYTQMNPTDSTNLLASYPSGWTDISSRVTWATANTATVSAVPLNDFAAAGVPIYLALRYTAPVGVAQSKWTVSALGLRHYIADTSYCIDSTTLTLPTAFPAWAISPGWGEVSVANPLVKFAPGNPYYGPTGANNYLYSPSSSATTTSFTVTGNTTAATAVATETWMLSGPINLHRVLRDGGLVVKDITTNASTTFYSSGGIVNTWANFSYKFTRRGMFEVTFLAANSTNAGENTMLKTIAITIQ
jgi:hypothetical protein